MTDNLHNVQSKLFDQKIDEYHWSESSSHEESLISQPLACTFISVDQHLLIHCSQIGLSRKLSLHLLELKNHLHSISMSHSLSPALIGALKHITNITNTEHDIELSQSHQFSLDWDVIVQYISTNIISIIVGNNSDSSAPISSDQSTLEELHIPLNYTGPDLLHTAHMLGLSETEFIHWHSSQSWNVAFMGFAPGFAYLRCNNGHTIPRRTTPRAQVPQGSVALGGEYCGIYPRDSPGGWQIIGTTTLEVWNPTAHQPNLITPLSTIRFIPI